MQNQDSKIFRDTNLQLLFGITLMAVIPLVDALPFFLIATVLYGLAHGINLPVVQTQLNEIAPGRYRAAYMSVNGLMIRLGQTLGPLRMLRVEHAWNIEGVFVGGAVLGLLGALLIAFTIRKS